MKGYESMIVKRGDVYFADLSPVAGSEQGGVRPVVIVQNDIGNRFSPTTIVAAITAQIQKAKLPTHVEIDAKKYGFERDSVILLEQIRTIDKMRLTDKITSLADDEEIMEKISFAYNLAGGTIDLDNETETVKQYTFTLDETVDFMEDHEYEFKEIKGGNPKNSVSNVAEYATSFLNSHGGRIFYGITNDRVVKGFSANPDMIDEIQKAVYSHLRNIDPGVSSNRYGVIFHPVLNEKGEEIEERIVLEVSVPATRHKSEIHFNKGKELFIRSRGVKELLQGSEIVSFIHSRLLEEKE
jgi:mRNA interferase MazF